MRVADHRIVIIALSGGLLVGLGAASCEHTVCAAGAQQSCACPSGVDGAQACAADGSQWQACDCGGGMGGAGGGGAGGAAGSTSSGGAAGGTSSGGPHCGDGQCDVGEDCLDCAADCGCSGDDLCDLSGQCVAPCGGGSCPACQKCAGSACVVDGAKDGAPCAGGSCQGGACVPCEPKCAGKCGGAPDGCGSTCDGPCPSGCCSGTTCVGGDASAACGHDGQACSVCAAPEVCSAGTCGCTADCTGKCGGAPDGCGDTCNGSCGSSKQHCVSQACVDCHYQTTIASGDYVAHCGGGAPICIQQATLNSGGQISITARKCDSSVFSPGDYYLYIFDPTDGVPGNHCRSFNAQKGHITLAGSSNTTITFPTFDSLLVCGGTPAQTEKGYCVTKAAPGDTAWFCSQSYVDATYE